VLLKVVAFATYIGNNLKTIGKTHLGDLRSAEFGFFGVVVYTRVHTPRFCGPGLHGRYVGLLDRSGARLRTSLVNRRHSVTLQLTNNEQTGTRPR